MSLYLLINILTISIPLVLSFDKRVHFYTSWRYLIPAMLITMAFLSFGMSFLPPRGYGALMNDIMRTSSCWVCPWKSSCFLSRYPMQAFLPSRYLNPISRIFDSAATQARILSFILMAVLIICSPDLHQKDLHCSEFPCISPFNQAWCYYRKPEILRRFYCSYSWSS